MDWKKLLKNEKQKPDYIDIDKDGDTTEPMKEAAKDAKMKKSKGDEDLSRAFDMLDEAKKFARKAYKNGMSKEDIKAALKKEGWEAFDLSFLED
jgi:thiamine pyrophosphate-dependent acetolactate synthase large subunit-like protein